MSRARIVEIARNMLNGQVSIVDGCVAICRARVDLDDTQLQNELLLPFIAFESEMHNFPIGGARKYWNETILKDRDARLLEIVDAASPEILDACRVLLDRWS